MIEKSLLRWYYRQTIESLRYEGPHFLLWRVLTKYARSIGRLGLKNLCQIDLTRPLGEIQAKVDISVCQATGADIEELSELVVRQWSPKAKQIDFYRDDILQRFDRGAKCFVGKIGTEIIHFNWIFFYSIEPAGGIGRYIRIGADEAICDDAYTAEAWRGQAIHTAIQNEMLLFLQQAGYRRAYTAVGAINKSSQKTHRRIGWDFTGTMLYFIPRGSKKAWIWRIKGTLDPFVDRKKPAH